MGCDSFRQDRIGDLFGYGKKPSVGFVQPDAESFSSMKFRNF